MKVLIVDKLSPETVTSLARLGMQVEVGKNLTAETLPGTLAGTDILVVRSTKVTAASIEAAAQLSLIIRAGAGVDTIDLAAASARGIYVANCPGKNTAAVAELAIGLLIAADRRIADATVAMRNGSWQKKEFGKARGLAGRTLGILGFGAIGKAVARRALGLEMKVIVWSRSLTPEAAEEAGVGYAASPEELAKAADAVSVHLASAAETKHLVGKKFLDALAPGTIFINTSRGRWSIPQPCGRPSPRRDSASGWTSSRASRPAARPLGPTRNWPPWPLAPRTSAPRLTRPPKPSPPKWCGSSRPSSAPATPPAPSTSPAAHPPRNAWSCGITTAWACWRPCSTGSARRGSTSRRWRTPSSRGPRRPAAHCN